MAMIRGTQADRAGIGFAKFGQSWPTEIFSRSAHPGESRTRADFARFSEMSENRETEMWSREDLNRRPLLRHFIAKLSADWAANSLKIKAAQLERASSPRIRLKSSETVRPDGPWIIAADSPSY